MIFKIVEMLFNVEGFNYGGFDLNTTDEESGFNSSRASVCH